MFPKGVDFFNMVHEISSTSKENDYLFTGKNNSNAVLIQRTIRSGQTLKHPKHIIILGDVNPGAEIIAGGNIIVFGRLRGVAHAGVFGNQNAIVVAFLLEPTQLRIANYITRAPDETPANAIQPEVAFVKDETIVIENASFLKEQYLSFFVDS